MRFGSFTVAASASVPARISGGAKLEVGGVDEVAGQRQLEAAADRHAVDAGDDRLVGQRNSCSPPKPPTP
jgi:hypothetical protein